MRSPLLIKRKNQKEVEKRKNNFVIGGFYYIFVENTE